MQADQPTTNIEQLRHVEQAASWRRSRMSTDVLNDPPAWLRTAIRTELENGNRPDAHRWSGIATRAVAWSDLSGTPADAGDLDGLLGPRPSNPALQPTWDELVADLAPPPAEPITLDAGLDLEL